MTAAYEASFQHIDHLAERVLRLTTAQFDAENQVMQRLLADYRTGAASAADAYAVYQRLRIAPAPALGKRWNAQMPSELQTCKIRWTAIHHQPDADGIWRGEYPIPDDSRWPPAGTSVVYVLFDAANEPCYVGSTAGFRLRLNQHHPEKPFVRWLAYPCADRAAAYALEDRLLKQHQPYLNRKASR